MIRTARLLLRPWRDDDLAPFAALNADPVVRRWFTACLTRAESDAQAARERAHFATHGFGNWVVEIPGQAAFIGTLGLRHVHFAAPFCPAIEIGWKLATPFWGQGYATEAGQAALAFGFRTLRLTEIVAFTVPDNRPSRAVMERIGMGSDPDGAFDHPLVAKGHPYRRHVLYRSAFPPLTS